MLNYLEDLNFLEELNNYNTRVQYAKITLLSFDETIIKEIQGTITAGSLNVNGSAAIRRTINLTMLVPSGQISLTNLNNDIALNKKIKVEIGYKNPLKNYSQYGDIIWFPCGVFVISSASTSKSTNGWTVSISGKDKMVLLDGSVGGTLPASVTFHERYSYDKDKKPIVEYPTIFQIIKEAVHHYGREDINNIIVNDISNKAKLLVKYIGDSPIYFAKDYNSFIYTPGNDSYPYGYKFGEDIGYEETDFTYPGELILNAGESVVSLLTKISNTLGNFEFFYDLNGKFIFQQKKNFLNVASPLLKDIDLNNYIGTYSNTSYKYSLTDLKTINSIGQSPKYDNIKNDFIVWGERETAAGAKMKIRYHLAIDTKPKNIIEGPDKSLCHKYITDIFFSDTKTLSRRIASDYPLIPDDLLWNEELGDEVEKPLINDNFEWREELYRRALLNSSYGVPYGPYDAELLAEWRKLYDPNKYKNGKWEDGWNDGWNPDIDKNPGALDYWLDFIDTNSAIGNYSVASIGRRTKVVNDTNINSIYNKDVQDIIFLSRDNKNFTELIEYYNKIGQTYVPLVESTFNQFAASSTKASAFDKIRDLLSSHLVYNTQINISCLPKYYIEPNNIIYIEDASTGIIGNYEISQYSLPLSHSGMMSITATEVLTRV